MTFPILGGNSAVSGYSIDNSLRFNDGDSPKLALSSFSPLYTFSSGTWSLWLKRSHLGTDQYFFSSHVQGGGDNKGVMLRWTDDYKIRILVEDGNNYLTWETSALFRDVSAWYHIHVIYSGSNIMDESNWTLKVNGVTQSGTVSKSGSQSTITLEGFAIGARYANSAYYLDGYATEYYFIDGSVVDVSNFAEADTDSGIWKPKEYTGTYGSKGFYLDFENSGSLGADQSGNGNNFTPTNLASTDQMLDTPTNNFATMNPLSSTNFTFSEGNLSVVCPGGSEGNAFSTIGLTTGKWYVEGYINSNHQNGNFGLADSTASSGSRQISGLGVSGNDIDKVVDGTFTDTGTNWATGNIVAFAVDIDNKTYTLYYNNTALVTDQAYTSDAELFVYARDTSASYVTSYTYNFGQDSSFAGNKTRQNNSDGNGYGDFYYAPPSGYLALCTQNLATVSPPTIDDGSQYFQPITYSGNGGNQDISANFDIDLAWIKSRTNAYNHVLIDTLRGNSNRLYSNATDAESTLASPNEINLDGSTLDLNGGVSIYNASGNNYITWLWNAGGTGVTNTDGSITSTVSANPTAGFSIVTYTGTGANATVGHGLGKALDMIIVKNRDRAESWRVGMTAIGFTKQLLLNATDAESTDSLVWQDTAPTSSVFSIGTRNAVNASGEDLVAYCFAEIEGYSKFGSYTGNITSGTDGAFVYTGFRPSWIMVKSSSNAGQEWVLFDSKRDSFNVATKWLYANASTAENGTADQRDVDFLSNGFKFRNAGGPTSYSGRTYIYMAFAENPFVTSGATPVTAR